MSLIQGRVVKGGTSVPYPAYAGVVVAAAFSHTLTAAPAVGDIIEIGCLPHGCRLVDAIIVSDDLDSNAAPLITLDVGVMSGEFGVDDAARICDASILSASQLARNGGVARPSDKGAFRIPATNKDRSIGVKVTAAAATFQQGKVDITLLYQAA